jgi:uncharacterized repeat protein (TIGR01451 family)
MKRSPWLRALRRWLPCPGSRSAAPRQRCSHTRPWLECLEDRVVPADLAITKVEPPTVVAASAATLTNGSTLSNTAGYTAAATPGGSASNTVGTAVTTAADLAVVKAGPSVITAGTSVTYTLTAANHGPSDSQSVTVSDALPAGLTLVSQTQLSGPDAFAPVSNGNAAAFFAAAMGAGHTDTFQVVALASGGLAGGSTVSNTAAVVSTLTPDPDPSNNTSTFLSTVTVSTHVALTLTAPPSVTFRTASQSFTASADVTGTGVPLNSGTVAFSVAGQSVSAPVSNGMAAAVITLPGGLAVGSYPITASFSGPPATASTTSPFAVTPSLAVINVTSVSDKFGLFNLVETLTAQVRGSNALAANQGTVTLVDGGQTHSVGVSNGHASATFTFNIFRELMTAFPHRISSSFSTTTGDFGSASTSFQAPGDLFGFFFQIVVDAALIRAVSGVGQGGHGNSSG